MIATFTQATTEQDILLTCVGGGVAQIDTTSSARAFDNYGNAITIKGRDGNLVEYRGTTDVRLEGEEASVRLPPPLLPPLRGGEDGWFRVKNLNLAEGEISGKAAVNFLNNPEFTINRFTGRITVNAKRGTFVGSCELIDQTAQERRF
jgi:hypothetical protein